MASLSQIRSSHGNGNGAGNADAGASAMSSDFAAFFRFREVAGKFVVTSHDGSFAVLTAPEFAEFAHGAVARPSPLWDKLAAANLIRAEFDAEKARARVARRKEFLKNGPNLHILVVTLRCNETCVYCHASRAEMSAVETDMRRETAERCVDLALASTSPAITIEFQGGEPLVNFEVVRHVIEYARDKNRAAGKTLDFTLVTNLALMDDDKLGYLLDRRVQICTSVDGPAHLHDKQRKLVGQSAHERAVSWIRRVNQAYEKMGLDPTLYRVEALLTTTRETLPLWKEVVDTYVDLGCRALFLRPLDPFGFAERTSGRIGYPVGEYLGYYRQVVDYMLALNAQGVQVLERFAAIFLTKILDGYDPNYLDIRSPCGAGIGQVAYNYDGKIFTCDEGRMLHQTGDDTFLIGDVDKSGYRELMSHETVRAMAIASNLEGQPDCVNCAYQPYCGVCPVYNFKTQGSLFGRMRDSAMCGVFKGIQDYLFEKIAQDDPTTLATLRKWTTNRAREHFVHSCLT